MAGNLSHRGGQHHQFDASGEIGDTPQMVRSARRPLHDEIRKTSQIPRTIRNETYN